MAQLVFKQEIVELIKTDRSLAFKVCEALDIAYRTLENNLKENPPRLATASSIKVIKDHTGIKDDSELLTELESANS